MGNTQPTKHYNTENQKGEQHSTNQKSQNRKLKRWATLNQPNITTQKTKKVSNTQPIKHYNTVGNLVFIRWNFNRSHLDIPHGRPQSNNVLSWPCQILSNMADRRVVHTFYVNKRCVFTWWQTNFITFYNLKIFAQ